MQCILNQNHQCHFPHIAYRIPVLESADFSVCLLLPHCTCGLLFCIPFLFTSCSFWLEETPFCVHPLIHCYLYLTCTMFLSCTISSCVLPVSSAFISLCFCLFRASHLSKDSIYWSADNEDTVWMTTEKSETEARKGCYSLTHRQIYTSMSSIQTCLAHKQKHTTCLQRNYWGKRCLSYCAYISKYTFVMYV